jgi:hypothetical protein
MYKCTYRQKNVSMETGGQKFAHENVKRQMRYRFKNGGRSQKYKEELVLQKKWRRQEERRMQQQKKRCKMHPRAEGAAQQSINGRGGEGGAAANYTPQSNYTPIRII